MSPVKASAITLPSDGHFMTTSETLSFIGNSLEVTYYDGTDYQTTTALYQTSFSSALTETSESPVGFVSSSGVPWLVYSFNPTRINTSPNYITVRLQPTYSIFDTNYLYTAVALSAGSNSPASTYTSPSCDWYIGGSVNHFENSSDSTSNSGRLAYLWMSGNPQLNQFYYNGCFTYVPIVHSSASTFSAYCMSCDFNGNSYGQTLVYYFLVMCPYVSGSASGGSGTFAPDSGGSGNINVNVDVDMDETNSLLDDIKQGIAGIGQTILGLFVPDDEFMENWIDDMQDLLHDHLGGMYEAVVELQSFWVQFENVQAKSSIHIGECRLPLAGSELVLGNWDVPLKPNGMPQVLYTSLALIIDFLAVMAFLRMCRNKLEIILNPNSEVVKE